MQKAILVIFLLLCHPVEAQELESIPFTDARWQINGDNSRLESYNGQASVKLDNNNGSAELQQIEFSNGIIEFDFAISSQAGFPGIQFRVQDGLNFEDVYFRAHMNDKADALAYAPTYGGNSTYQLFHGVGFWGHFAFEFNEWTHARLVISGDQGELYLRDMNTPVMFMHDLKRNAEKGSISLRGGSDVRFANFRMVHSDRVELKGEAPKAISEQTGVLNLTSWRVSVPFPESDMEGVTRLTEAAKNIGGWDELEADDSHIANFMRLRDLSEQGNTVFARVTITSDRNQDKLLSLGYSDRARVFLNGQMLYAGDTGFRTRDYRYLGSIGFFEQVVLPLSAGDNEVWIAVSESFGGWGLQARILDADNVRVSSQ